MSLWLPPQYRRKKAGENAAGVVDKVVYFENKAGHIILAVVHTAPTPTGYVRREVNTPFDIAKLSQRYAKQKQDEFDSQDARVHLREERRIGAIIERLRRRRQQSDCKQFERDFIARAIPMLEPRIDKHRSKREMCFHQEAYEAGTFTE